MTVCIVRSDVPVVKQLEALCDESDELSGAKKTSGMETHTVREKLGSALGSGMKTK